MTREDSVNVKTCLDNKLSEINNFLGNTKMSGTWLCMAQGHTCGRGLTQLSKTSQTNSVYD